MKDPTAEKVIEILAEEVFGLESTDLLFNPYTDVDPRFDKPNASEIRRENVKVYVRSCFSNHKDATWLIIGEAPGPHGCRFSGVPFTNEDQLLGGCLTFSGLQSSKGKEPFHAPASKIFWKIMLPYALQGKSFFIWNCVPLHPHKNGKASFRSQSNIKGDS
jgi:Uracil DNA glycosylase superfamily